MPTVTDIFYKVMKMKKAIAVLISLIFVFLLCSCSKEPIPDETTPSDSSEIITEATTEEMKTELLTTTENNSSKSNVLQAGSGSAVLQDGKTYTGREPLPCVEFKVTDLKIQGAYRRRKKATASVSQRTESRIRFP